MANDIMRSAELYLTVNAYLCSAVDSSWDILSSFNRFFDLYINHKNFFKKLNLVVSSLQYIKYS